MIKIVFYTKDDCEACRIMNDILLEAVLDVKVDIDIKKINKKKMDSASYLVRDVKVYPTIVILDNFKEIATLEGTYPKEYIKNILNKLKNECN